MKNLKFILALALLMTFSMVALPQAASFETNTSTLKVYYVIDTVSNSTGVTIDYPYTIPAGWQWSVQTVADSLSGSTAGTMTLLSSNSVNGTVYETISSGTNTINGLQTLKTWSATTAWSGSKLRVTASGGGTQSTKIRVWILLKKIPVY